MQAAADNLPHAAPDEAGGGGGLLAPGAPGGGVHQLVDLRRHRLLDDVEQNGGVDLVLAQLGAADAERAEAALVVGGDGHGLEDALDLVGAEAVALEALARAPLDE